ncbi:hypothetical protein V3C99_001086, partial [Haemonchus contortus]
QPAMLLVFGVLLLTSSVLSKNDNLDSIYKAIKDITGFERSDFMKINEDVIAMRQGKQVLKKDRDFQKALNPLPLDASRFMLIHSGMNPKLKRPRLESKFRGKISKKSCSKLLKKFPGL